MYTELQAPPAHIIVLDPKKVINGFTMLEIILCEDFGLSVTGSRIPFFSIR